MAPVNIICIKSGSLYSSDYVNHLYSMVKRCMGFPFRFFCLTDDRTGIYSKVECLPLPIGHSDVKGRYQKLGLWKKDLFGLSGRSLFLDLDLVITQSINCFFEMDSKFAVIQDWFNLSVEREYNTSVILFEIGILEHVYNAFMADCTAMMRRYPGDQAILSTLAPGADFFPEDWCVSFKLSQGWKQKPPSAKIVVFHGQPNPHEAIMGGHFKIYLPPCSWIEDFWRQDEDHELDHSSI